MATAISAVVVQDNIYGADVADWLDQVGARPKHLVVLRPSTDAVAEREEARKAATGKTHTGAGAPVALAEAPHATTSAPA